MPSEIEGKSGKPSNYGFGVAWEQWFRDTWNDLRVQAGVEPHRGDTTFDIVEIKIR